MRKFVTSGALCAIVLTTSLASAKDDFSALLSELSYAQPGQSQAAMPSYKIASNANTTAEVSTPSVSAPAPQAAIQMPQMANQPAASYQATDHQATQPTDQYNHVGPAPAALQQGCDVGCADGGCAAGGCADGGCASGGCGQDGFCTPHNQPNLPGSTLRQYWRSNACNSNVWDGYQNECRKPMGPKKERNCFGRSHAPAPIVVPSQAPCDTPACDVQQYIPAQAACDSGSCDANAYTF